MIKIQKYKTLIIIIFSIFIIYSLNLNLDPNFLLKDSLYGNSINIFIYFILIYWLLKNTLEIKNKRLKICVSILAIILSTLEVVGYSIDVFKDLSAIFLDYNSFIKSLIKWIGYIILFFALFVNIFNKIDLYKTNNIKFKEFSWLKNSKKTFFIVWAIIFIAWIPYFLNYYPGVVTADSRLQIGIGLGIDILANHHPIFHTFLISIAMHIGKWLGNYNLGIAIYSICQMLVLSSIFSFSIYYMGRKKVNIYIRLLSLIFYAFYPVNAIYSITMWKDIPFSGCMLLFTIFMVELASNSKTFMSSKLRNILFTLVMILVILFRNNGLYVIILTIPFMFIFARKEYKKLIIISLSVFIFYALWKGPVFSLFHVEEGSIREAFSIPLQSFARISKYHSEDLTENEKQEIYKYLPVENIGDYYYPIISDPVKQYFNNEAFAKDKIGFFKLWIKLFFKYPKTSVEAFLSNSYGYWYPEAIHWVVDRVVCDTDVEKWLALNLKSEPIIEIKPLEQFDNLIQRRDIPLNSMLYSIGFTFWVVLTMFIYAIYSKKYQMILVFIPIFMLWLTCLASPVFAEFRYIYSLFTCLPILVGINFIVENKKE